MISYSVPFYIDDVLMGVVGMDIDFKLLKKVVDKTPSYDTGYAFLTDQKANILYHKSIPAGTPMSQVNEGEFISFAEALEVRDSDDSLYAYTYNGEKKKAAFYSLANGMKFVLTAPTREIDFRSNKLIIHLSVWIVIVMFVSAGVSIAMTRNLIKPLVELNIAARKIAEGDLNVSLTCQSKDEIGTLSESFRKTTEHLKKYIDYINNLAYRDLLTGMKNRTAYEAAAKQLDEQIRLKSPEFAIVVFDINGLKEINDTRGHDFGDMVIIECTKIICKTFKKCPVYRIGGDEFVVIIEGEMQEQHVELMNSFHEEMEAYRQYPYNPEGVSIASGIAVFSFETDVTFSDVFKRADTAMYQNKKEMKKV